MAVISGQKADEEEKQRKKKKGEAEGNETGEERDRGEGR